MKRTLLKHCKKQLVGEPRENSMLVIGREMFDRKDTRKDVPMYKVRNGKLIK